MNPTTRRFPRTLAEAFPDDSLHRAEYGCAVKKYKSESVPSRGYVSIMCACFAIGLLTGALLWA